VKTATPEFKKFDRRMHCSGDESRVGCIKKLNNDQLSTFESTVRGNQDRKMGMIVFPLNLKGSRDGWAKDVTGTLKS
jgi:hypothetical protein